MGPNSAALGSAALGLLWGPVAFPEGHPRWSGLPRTREGRLASSTPPLRQPWGRRARLTPPGVSFTPKMNWEKRRAASARRCGWGKERGRGEAAGVTRAPFLARQSIPGAPRSARYTLAAKLPRGAVTSLGPGRRGPRVRRLGQATRSAFLAPAAAAARPGVRHPQGASLQDADPPRLALVASGSCAAKSGAIPSQGRGLSQRSPEARPTRVFVGYFQRCMFGDWVSVWEVGGELGHRTGQRTWRPELKAGSRIFLGDSLAASVPSVGLQKAHFPGKPNSLMDCIFEIWGENCLTVKMESRSGLISLCSYIRGP